MDVQDEFGDGNDPVYPAHPCLKLLLPGPLRPVGNGRGAAYLSVPPPKR